MGPDQSRMGPWSAGWGSVEILKAKSGHLGSYGCVITAVLVSFGLTGLFWQVLGVDFL